MHFDTGENLVPKRAVRKSVGVEIGAEFAIDAREKVFVECGGDALCVVIGSHRIFCFLYEIDADEKSGARTEKVPAHPQEACSLVIAQIADLGRKEPITGRPLSSAGAGSRPRKSPPIGRTTS